MSRIISSLFILFSLFSICSAQIVNGPFQGHTTENSVMLWLQAKSPFELKLKVNETGEAFETEDESNYGWKGMIPVSFAITGLEPGKTYTCSVSDGENILADDIKIVTRSQEMDFSFLAGSCAMHNIGIKKIIRSNRRNKIYSAMSSTPSDFMLWLGDNIYLLTGEWNSIKKINRKYSKVRKDKRTDAFMKSRSHYAIRDDHDYGPNNGTRDFENKELTTQAFRNYWPQPYENEGDNEDLRLKFSFSDCAFFLLDGRISREEEAFEEMYGKSQMDWLKDNLKNSSATFKFIAGGSQFLNEGIDSESFKEYKEYTDLMDFIRNEKIEGVIFLSGDRHFTELLRQDNDEMYPLYELTSSPLTSIVRHKANKKNDPEFNNPLRVEGSKTTEHNFCRINVKGPEENRELNLEIFDNKGQQIWSYSIFANDLKWK